ncbi:hypothetical protein PISMIDRAFT_444960 [Pisolithus microcarpus 441]|uniref:Uncharacterized protein n=1 Tax=Pisolithus microcarpus 441 TaxID=765257 RepID=A0A0C9ZV17_9AGAM|nr:hypothetical protein BKA83DRAFT_444960 [Pisolithus microcarpus]KIK29869.1 hypothetical protein PISMIDRAFT_444960 [Pisolithus microcarpus 441]
MSSVTDASEEAVNAYISSIQPSFDFILAGTALSACLFTLLVTLFVFSTRETRRHVVFRLNVFAICLAMTLGVFIGLACGKLILDPFNSMWKGFYATGVAFALYPPILYDSILLTRLFALYPLGATPSVTLVKIFAFPFCIKCARVIVLTLFFSDYIEYGFTAQALAQQQNDIWYRNPKITAEWVMQMADNLYSVSLFLYNLHIRTSLVQRVGGISERIRQVFYVSVANFVFPLFFNIAQIILDMTNRQSTAGAVVIVINHYVTVIGVLCATLWFSGSEWARTRSQPISGHGLSGKSNSEQAHGSSGKSRGEILVIGKSLSTLDTASLEAGPVKDARQITTLDGHTLV